MAAESFYIPINSSQLLTFLHVLANICYFLLSFFFCLFRALPVAYGSSQARGLIRAVAAGLRHSHSKARSELCLGPTPQLTAMLDP